MHIVSVNTNLTIYTPFCCSSNQEDFTNKILDAFNIIRTTQIGQNLLEKIARGIHRIEITTHPLTQSCEKTEIAFRTKAANRRDSFDPSKGSPSTIYITPGVETQTYFTQRHYRFCISRALVSTKCGESHSGCIGVASLARVLFHELIHAEHNQKGINQSNNKSVPSIYKNAEEKETIELENEFAIEIEELVTKEKLKIMEFDLIQRYGFYTPENPLQREILATAMRAKVFDFLIISAPNIILQLGMTLSPLFRKQLPKDTPSEEDLDDEELYNY